MFATLHFADVFETFYMIENVFFLELLVIRNGIWLQIYSTSNYLAHLVISINLKY